MIVAKYALKKDFTYDTEYNRETLSCGTIIEITRVDMQYGLVTGPAAPFWGNWFDAERLPIDFNEPNLYIGGHYG